MAMAHRADHIGSFLRPPELLDARARGVEGDELRAIEDRAILDVIEKQRAAGFDIYTDGEFRRDHFQSDILHAVDGFDTDAESGRTWRSGATVATPARVSGVVVSKLTPRRRMTGDQVAFLKQHAPGAVKMTIASATQYPAIMYKTGISEQAYPDRSAFLRDLAEINAAEAKAIADDGVAYLQIDAPRYSYYIDEKWREFLRSEMKRDPADLLAEAVATDNLAFKAARRPGIILAIHLCRGNNRSQWYAEGGYDAIAEQLFTQLDADRFLLEYDDDRSGSFAPLRFVPADKVVTLGLVSTKRPELENPDDIARRIDAAAKVVPLERLSLSPQCGFASMAEGNVIDQDAQWAKMRLVREVVRRVWGE